LILRHKVIGFVDAATRQAAAMSNIARRHKVIGFVDAATKAERARVQELTRHKVIGFVDAATEKGQVRGRNHAPATRSLASWMPRPRHS